MNMRASASLITLMFCKSADYGKLSALFQRQYPIVFKQHHTVLGNFLCKLMMLFVRYLCIISFLFLGALSLKSKF